MKRIEPMSHDQSLEILNKVCFFDAFLPEEKDILTGLHSHFFVAKKGEPVIRQGDNDTSFFVILTGSVYVRKEGSRKMLARLKPGDSFGEISFLTNSRRTSTVIAECTSIIFEIDQPTLKFLDPGIREKLKDNIIQVLVDRLDTMNKQVVALSAQIH